MNVSSFLDAVNEYITPDVDDIVKTICEHHIEAWVYLELLKEDKHLSIKSALKNEAFMSLIHNKLVMKGALELIETLNTADIEYRILKGPESGRHYPDPSMKHICDLDVWISPGSEHMVKKLFESKGFVAKYNEMVEDKEFKMLKSGFLPIEIHRGLFNIGEISQQDQLGAQFWSNSSTQKLYDIEFRTLSPTDHLQYMVCHFITHLKRGGIGIKQVIDIGYYLESHPDSVTDLRKVLKYQGYELVFEMILQILEMFFSMELSYETIAAEVVEPIFKNQEVIDFFTYLIKSGSYGHGNEEVNAANYYETYISKRKNVAFLGQVRRLLFPYKASEISFEYSYARKYPVLLPFAWCHRYCRFILRPNLKSTVKMFFYTGKKRVLLKHQILAKLKII